MTPPVVAVVLPGAGGAAINSAIFADNAAEAALYPSISYPRWPRYVADDFGIPRLLCELADAIEAKVPHGPVCIVGVSLGGHIGYALAVLLQRRGRTIGGFCALDSFMVTSAGPQEGWGGRAFSRALSLVRESRLDELGVFVRERFWRALLRAGGERVPILLRRRAQSGRLPWLLRNDPKFEEELSMRLLIRRSVPWLAELDREPVALQAPAVLIRTPLTAGDDEAWRKRCPQLRVVNVSGNHQTLFDEHNLHLLRAAFREATTDWRRRV
jgi:thioesterase domain-containing protein